MVLARIAPPDEYLFDGAAHFSGNLDGFIGFGFVVEHFAVTVVAVHRDEDFTARVHRPFGAGFAAEAGEDDRVNDAQTRTRQHGDGQFKHHGHVNGHAVARFQAQRLEHGGDFVDAHKEFLVSEHEVRFIFRLGYKDESGFVAVFGQVAVNAVVAGVQLAAHKPLPEGRIAGVERCMPVLVPVEQVGVFFEALREVFLAETLVNGFIRHVRLGDEVHGGIVVIFFAPMYRHFRFGDFRFGVVSANFIRHGSASFRLFNCFCWLWGKPRFSTRVMEGVMNRRAVAVRYHTKRNSGGQQPQN